MDRTRINKRDRRPSLENLETRDVPAVFNPLSAWAGILRGVPATVGDAVGTPTTNTGSLTPNFPGGTTDPTTPGLPNPGNPLFPGRTTFLRSGPINPTPIPGGVITTPGGTVTTPNVTVPGTTFRFNTNFLRTGPLTPNFPGGTTDPTTPGLPNTGNPLFPGRTTFLRSGPINVGGGTINTGGGVITTPGVTIPGANFNFNTSFLRTGSPGFGITNPGVGLPPGDVGLPGVPTPGFL